MYQKRDVVRVWCMSVEVDLFEMRCARLYCDGGELSLRESVWCES